MVHIQAFVGLLEVTGFWNATLYVKCVRVLELVFKYYVLHNISSGGGEMQVVKLLESLKIQLKI